LEDLNPYESPRTEPSKVPTLPLSRNKPAKEPDYRQWAVSAVILPAIVLLCGIAIVAGVWGSDIAAILGDRLGYIFLWYLLGLTLVAVVHKIISEKRPRRNNRNDGKRHPPDADASRQESN
jgi:hypothetical protein